MDTQTLVEGLREFISGEWEWKFALYSTHKSRDGLELDWNSCKMKGISDWVEVLRIYLLEKTLAERTVAEYSPFLSKENIPALLQSDDIIKDQIWNTIVNIKNGLEYAPEDFASGVAPKPAGYGFYGCRKDEEGKVTEEVLFMRRTNPFLSGQRVRLCTTNGNEIVTSNNPLLKFMPTTDFLLLDGICFFFSPSIEKDFDLENRNFAIASRRMKDVGDADIISNFEQFEKSAYAAKNARKFTDYDKTILEHITRLPIVEREEFLLKYGVTIDHEGRMETYDPEQCELIIDLLCGRSCLDALGRLAVGSNITLRE